MFVVTKQGKPHNILSVLFMLLKASFGDTFQFMHLYALETRGSASVHLLRFLGLPDLNRSRSEREFQETVFLEECRALNPSATGGMETHIQPFGEGYDKLIVKNDTGGYHCFIGGYTRPNLKKLN